MQSFTLFYTAAPRVQFALRTLAPRLTCEFAVAHDAVVLDTLRPLLCAEESEKLSSLPPAASRVAQLALRHGGLGLLKAALHAPAAFWTFWADSCVVRSGCTLLARSGATSLQAFRFGTCSKPLTFSSRPVSAPPFGLTAAAAKMCWVIMSQPARDCDVGLNGPLRVCREAGATVATLRRDPCVAADPNGPAATLHGGARRRHVASCRAAQANHLPRAQLERSAAAPRARLRDRWAVERDGAVARQRLGAHPSPTGPASEAEGPSRLPLR